jgi:hypothetical protein
MIANISPVLGEMIRHQGEVIHAGAYANAQSSVKMCAAGFETFARQAREAGISSEFPDFAVGLSKRALAAGFGDEEFGAVIKVLRSAPHSVHARNASAQIAA